MAASMKEFNRVGKLNLEQIINQSHTKDDQKEYHCIYQGIHSKLKIHPYIVIQNF